MKQPTLPEKIILIAVEGISIGISSAIRIFISLILHLLFGISAFASPEQSNNVSLPLSKKMKIKVRKSQACAEAAHFDNDKFADPVVTREIASSQRIQPDSSPVGFTEANGSPLFVGLIPNDICILCRYWYSRKFDCIIVL